MNVLPGLATDDVIHGGEINPAYPCEFYSAHGRIGASNISNLFVRKFGEVERFSTSLSAFSNLISRVTLGRRKKQVGGVTATRIVARMANVHPRQNRAIDEGVREDMRFFAAMNVDPSVTVARTRTQPRPAIIRPTPVNPFPKVLCNTGIKRSSTTGSTTKGKTALLAYFGWVNQKLHAALWAGLSNLSADTFSPFQWKLGIGGDRLVGHSNQPQALIGVPDRGAFAALPRFSCAHDTRHDALGLAS